MGTSYEISSVLTGENGQPPIIVEFENGKINPDLPTPLKCKLYKDGDDSSKKYVTLATDNTSYIGCHESSSSPLHTYLAICNRKTHKAQLVKVESVRVTAATGRKLEPFLPKIDALSDSALLDLSRKFGSKVSKRLQESRLKFHLIAKSDAHLQEVVQEKQINTDNLDGKPEDTLQTLLPPCNYEALSPSEVYNIHDILTKDEMKSLQEGFDTKETKEEEAFIKKCSPLFNSLVESCSKDAEKMSLLLYAEYLIRLCNRKRVKSYDEICDCSEDVAYKMAEEFTMKKGSSRSVSQADLDKAVLRIIIINLYLSDFKMPVLPLANSLRHVVTTRIRTLIKVTGANFPSTFSGQATLTVPVVPFKISASPFVNRKRRV